MGLSLRGQTSGAIDINAPNVAGDNTITLPGTNGAANQFYKNSGTAGIVTHSSMVEDSSGNIGIGTDNPDFKFHSNETGGSSIAGLFETNQTDSFISFQASGTTASSTVRIGAVADEFVAFINGGYRLRIDSSGNVKLGTPSTTFTNAKSLSNYLGIADNYAPGLMLKVPDLYTGEWSFYLASAASVTDFVIADDSAERLRIDSSGVVKLTQSGNNPRYGSFEASSDAFKLKAFSGNASHNATMQFFTGTNSPTERMRIDSAGRLLIGHSTAATIRNLSPVLAVNTPDSSASISIVRQGNDVGDSRLLLGKNRNASPTGNTILVNEDPLGQIVFCGNDGIDMDSRGAEITAAVNGTPGADDMPTSLTFAVTQSGDNSPTARFKIYQTGQSNFFTDSNFNIRSVRTAGSEAIFQIKSAASSLEGGTTEFVVRADGDCENTNNRYGALSDVKLKENIVDAGSQWDDLKAIKVKKYNFKAETNHSTHTQIGVIAQEIELICPGLVKETKDVETVEIPILDSEGNPVLDDEGNPRVKYKEQETGEVTKTVGYSVLYMKAVKALQEAMGRIETLETQNADLLSRVTALEG